MKPLVSIIIPTFNRSLLIADTLNSILGQTYSNWECIVVDDGSTDYTNELLEFYCEKDNRFFHYHRPTNRLKGASACRNYGLEKSKGSYIQFLDSDDLLSKSKIRSQVEILEKEVKASMATCKWGRFSFEEKEIKIYKNLSSYKDFTNIELFLDDLANSFGFFPIHAYLIRKTNIDKVGYWNEYLSLNDDMEFIMRIIINSNKIVFSDKGNVFYRWPEEGNVSQYSNKQKVIDAINSWKLIEIYLKIRFKTNEINFVESSKKALFLKLQNSFQELIDEEAAFFDSEITEYRDKQKIGYRLKRFERNILFNKSLSREETIKLIIKKITFYKK